LLKTSKDRVKHYTGGQVNSLGTGSTDVWHHRYISLSHAAAPKHPLAPERKRPLAVLCPTRTWGPSRLSRSEEMRANTYSTVSPKGATMLLRNCHSSMRCAAAHRRESGAGM